MNFYGLTHFLQLWLIPPGLILLLMLISILLSFKTPRIGRVVLLTSLIFFWLLCTPFFVDKLFTPLENVYQPLKVKDLSNKNAAIIVLGAGVDTDNTYKRIKYAAALHNKIHAPIIVSGGNRGKGKSEAEMMRDELWADYKIPTLDIEADSRNTSEESKNLIPILTKHHIERVYLVTQAFHMPRSMYAFTSQFKNTDVHIIPAPTGYVSVLSNDHFANYMPQTTAFNASVIIIHEYVGLLWYHILSRFGSA